MDKEKIFKTYKNTDLFLDYFLASPKKVQQLLMIPIIENKCYPRFWGEEMKSPIEQIFITAFDLYCKDKTPIFLLAQEKITCNNKTYYPDFLFDSDDYLAQLTFKNRINNLNFKLAIECDGYEFHQKTKEQVQHDNEREYDLKMAGYETLRFSGTQIFNNPIKCAEDTYNYIIKRIKEK